MINEMHKVMDVKLRSPSLRENVSQGRQQLNSLIYSYLQKFLCIIDVSQASEKYADKFRSYAYDVNKNFLRHKAFIMVDVDITAK